MSWHGIEGHDAVVERFRLVIERGRLASTYLLVGTEGIGKCEFAVKLAQSLLCHNSDDAALEPCGACDSCVQVEAGTHPDLNIIRKPEDKTFIPVEMFIGDRQHRMREGLCRWIAMSPMAGKRKIAIIDDADFLNEEGANALLKTLEEPPLDSLLMLVGTSADRQLPTIRSRAQIMRFQPLADEIVTRLLIEQQVVTDASEAGELARLADGSFGAAIELADEELAEFRRRFLTALAAPTFESVRVASMVTAFVDDAGRDAPRKRMRLRQTARFAVEFFREQLRSLVSNDESSSVAWIADADIAADLIDRTLATFEHINRNAHLTNTVECWMDDLYRISARGFVQT